MPLNFPTILPDLLAPNILAYPIETVVAEKTQALVELGFANSRMKDFADIAMAARRLEFQGDTLVAALKATFERRQTDLPDQTGGVALSDRFLQNAAAQTIWKAFANRNRLREFQSLEQVISELRRFLILPIEHAKTDRKLTATWHPGGPWIRDP